MVESRSGESKSGVLYAQLRRDLTAGEFAPGARISEAELSRVYGVSRSPIREAVVRLEAEGLLSRSGMVISVRARSEREIIDIYRVRVHLEAEIAADAARRREELDVVRLRAAVDAEAAIDSTDPTAVVEANRRFHAALAEASHNLTLVELQGRLTAQIATLPATTLRAPGRWERAHAEHGEIAEAVALQDAETAARIARAHMQEAKDLRVEYVTRQAMSG